MALLLVYIPTKGLKVPLTKVLHNFSTVVLEWDLNPGEWLRSRSFVKYDLVASRFRGYEHRLTYRQWP